MPGIEVARIEPPVAAIAARDAVAGLLRPVAAPAEVLAAQNETRQLVHQALKEGRDYGVIPGTGDKPTLLKPGAERINAAFACAPRYRVIESEIDHFRTVEWTKRKKQFQGKKFVGWKTESGTSQGLYRYVVECELVHRASGTVIGQGMASASTMESKYIDRPRDSENVVLKMAEKRAFIAATLNAYGLSDEFTQDVEDLQPATENGVTTPTPARAATKDRASTGQVDEIRHLLAAEGITVAERDQMNAALTKGLSAARAEAAIAKLRATIIERTTQTDDDVAEQPKEHPALTQARQVYRAALEKHRPDLLYDTDALDEFEETTVGRPSREQWLAREYVTAAEAVAQITAEPDEEA